jgi:hypothetical protein
MTDNDQKQQVSEKKTGEKKTGEKKKALKLTLIIVLAIIVLLSAAFRIFGEKAITAVASKVATNTLGVKVDIEAITLKLFSGQGAIKGLVVGNPADFKLPYAMSMDEGTIAIDTSTLLSDEIHIKSINLDNISINFEQKGLKSNFQVIAEGLKPVAEVEEPAETAPAADAGTEVGSGKKVVVDELRITNAKVSVKLIGQLKEMSFKLPEIVLKDLGKNDKMTLAEMSELIFTKITEAIAQAGSGIIPSELTGALSNTLNGAVGLIGDTLEGVMSNDVGKSIEDAGKALGEESGKLLEGFGGLLGGKKEEK